MKSIICGVVLLLLICVALYPSTRVIEPGFVQTGVTGTPQDSYTFVQVMVPRDLAFACTSSEAAAQTCIIWGEMVDLNQSSVDAILISHHMLITRNGAVIFDYRKSNPRQ